MTEADIMRDLAGVGVREESLTDLRESGRRYTEAVPVLVSWLPRTKDDRILEEVVRALSVPWAKRAALRPLIHAFHSVPPDMDPTGLELRWAIGNALNVLWDDKEFEALAEIARDRTYGRAREMVVLGLGRSKRPEARDVLAELLDDDAVDGHAVNALARLGAPPQARSSLERFMDDRRAWVRRSARKALEKPASR